MAQLEDQGLPAPPRAAIPKWRDNIQLLESSRRDRYDCEAGPIMNDQTPTSVTATSSSSRSRISEDTSATGLRSRHRFAPPHEGPSDGRAESFLNYYASRRDETGADYCLLIGWSAGKEYEVIDIPVRDPDDEMEVYRQIHQEWYKRRSSVNRFWGMKDVVSIQRAKVRAHRFDASPVSSLGS